mmetsp:Transcript_27048/g.71234  ORF Transcript_27048/g.71234 Transcript_27048/m.71234 type:complete len:98 (-) Transcript_27048:787-1080(-)
MEVLIKCQRFHSLDKEHSQRNKHAVNYRSVFRSLIILKNAPANNKGQNTSTSDLNKADLLGSFCLRAASNFQAARSDFPEIAIVSSGNSGYRSSPSS